MHRSEQRALDPKARLLVEGLLFVGLPVVIVAAFLAGAYHQGILSYDFVQFLLPAGEKVAHGGSPYPGYGYPPLVAFAAAPFTWIPAANVVWTLLLIPCVPASLWFLGVRDWRCYGVVFAWSPVLAALQSGNVTIPLLLGSAICWHGRDRWRTAAVSGGLTVAAKLLTVPLIVWLAATRRFVAAAGVAVVAGAVSFVLWAILGFSYVTEYPGRVRTIQQIESPDSYTVKALLEDAGVSSQPARVVWTLLALAVVAAVVYFGWKGDDRRSFALCGVAMIAAVPVVWMHSFTLLLLPIAVMRPRLSAAWLVPILCVVGSGNGNGSPFQNAAILAIAAVTVVLALLPSRESSPASEARGGHLAPGRVPSRRDTVAMEVSSDRSLA